MNNSTIFVLNDEFEWFGVPEILPVCGVHEILTVHVVFEFYLWVQVCEFLSCVRVHELCVWVQFVNFF